MGNNIIQSQPTPQPIIQKTQQQYSYISQPKQNIIGKPRIVKSNITNIQLQEYYVSNTQSSIQYDINLYKLRSSSYSKNIAVIFNHKLIDEQQKLFKVRVEKMKGRLNQIDGINYIQGLCLLEAGLNGFAELVFHAKTPFVITERMIAINQNSQVRVWLNQNYSLNKIMPGIKIRNQNIMIHQIFSAVAQHIVLEERQIFNEFRFKIAQCQRLIQAKNVISMTLQNTNRKAILQQLIQKQIIKQSQVLGNNNYFQYNNQNHNHNHNQNQNHNIFSVNNTNNNYNGNINQNVNMNPPSNIKISMNFLGMASTNNVSNNVPNINNNNNNNIPTNPLASFNENPTPQKVHIATQQYIKDDQGSDRIRMVRQQPNPNLNSNIKTLNMNNQIIPTQNTQPVTINNKTMIGKQQTGNRNFNQLNQINNNNNNNQKNIVIIGSSQSQNANLRQEQKVASNQPEQNTQRNNQRQTTIFGPNKKNQSSFQVNSNNNNIQIKTLSPLKTKPINQLPTTNTLSTKIALSQNKISQMQRKINKLKQQFNKNHARKNQVLHTGIARNDNRQQRIRFAVTPPHAAVTHRSPINQEIRPVTKHQKISRLKSDSHVGQTAAKWDRKLNQLISKQLNKTMDEKRMHTNINFKNQRHSQILSQQFKELRRSMAGQGRRQEMNKSPSFNKTSSPFRNQITNERKGQNSDRPTSFNLPPQGVKINNQPIVMSKSPSANNLNTVYVNQRFPPHPQPKVNINFHGNPYINNINNINSNNVYTNPISFGGLTENKSSIIPRNSHF